MSAENHSPVVTKQAAAEVAGSLPIAFPIQPQNSYFACDGIAKIEIPHAGLCVRGDIVDLGESGCFVKAPAFNLERGTHVEVLLETHQLNVRVAGSVSGLHPHEGVDIGFLSVSPRTARILASLVSELQASSLTSASPKSANLGAA
ncbi:PilZ domain-containing protein [Silvibacterium sp.]|uniref:PilZ domain-containing protein n=1 Tax=Silvibacterium sp. TaxID=1964179 RepID=UPI0039E6A3AB